MSLYIKEIHIKSFGQFSDFHLSFDDGFNLIYGDNESGKSTLTSFIEGLLYGFDEGINRRNFNDKHKIYYPTFASTYGGYGIFNKDGRDYRVSRNFADGDYEIYDLNSKEVIDAKHSKLNFPGEYLLGLDYETYKSIIASYQAQESSAKAKDRVAEILFSKDQYNFSANEAINLLQEKYRKEVGSTSAYTKPLKKTKKEINDIENQIDELSSLRRTYYRDFKDLDKNRTDISRKTETLKELRAKRDAYRENVAYKNLEDEINWRNELNFVNNELKKFDDIEMNEVEIDTESKSLSFLLYIAISLVLIVLSVLSEKYFLIPLAIIVPLLAMIYLNRKETDETLEDKRKYNKKANRDEYLSLIKEKEKIEEILKVLANQDKTTDRENMMEIKSLDIGEVERKIRKLESDLELLTASNLELEKKLASAEEKLAKEVDLVEKRDNLLKDLKEIEDKARAIDLAIEYITEIKNESEKSHDAFDLMVAETIKAISKGKYQEISFDDRLSPQIKTNDGLSLSLDQLSTGFFDQLNFALKYSINDISNENFLVFDDAFINYDMDRLRRALLFLFDLASKRQVIYMTCHKREEELLNSEGISYSYINLEEV